MIFAAILAGGIGSRMGGTDIPKQFLTLGDKPVIVHTIEKFVINEKIDKIIVLTPQNYINHIKEHMDEEDIIFVSSHKVVRDALKEEGIPYYLVYPRKDMKEEWMTRFKKRGNDENFIKFQDEHWDEFIEDMENDAYPTKIVLEDYLCYNAITITVINNIMNYGEE